MRRPIHFSFEVPLYHLEDFEDLQDFHFILVQLLQNRDYRSFYQAERNKGLKTLWLDNGFNEVGQPLGVEALAHWAEEMRMDKVICPDHPNWTRKEFWEAYDRMSIYLPGDKLIMVTSSRKEWHYFHQVRDVGYFAVPYRARVGWEGAQEWLLDTHFLGLNSILELLKWYPNSCDTSMPIKLALQDKTLSDWDCEGYPHIHTKDLGLEGGDYFQTRMTPKQIKLARANITTLKEVCNANDESD
jgi:hypothetical protein